MNTSMVRSILEGLIDILNSHDSLKEDNELMEEEVASLKVINEENENEIYNLNKDLEDAEARIVALEKQLAKGKKK